MPGISLRLTDEQHAQVEAWAQENRRSMQKEIIHRLFDTLHVPKRSGVGEPIPADRPARPDPKPTRAEKKGRR